VIKPISLCLCSTNLLVIIHPKTVNITDIKRWYSFIFLETEFSKNKLYAINLNTSINNESKTTIKKAKEIGKSFNIAQLQKTEKLPSFFQIVKAYSCFSKNQSKQSELYSLAKRRLKNFYLD
jgi:hypothetical protein